HPRRGTPPEPRLRHRPSVVRDERLVHQPGARPARAVAERRHLREARLHAAQAARRGGRSPPPREARGEAHAAHAEAGGVHRRRGCGPVQVGPLPLLGNARPSRSWTGSGARGPPGRLRFARARRRASRRAAVRELIGGARGVPAPRSPYAATDSVARPPVAVALWYATATPSRGSRGTVGAPMSAERFARSRLFAGRRGSKRRRC